MKNVFEKSDLSIVPRWTDNIDDKWINPFITQTCQIAFRDSISTTLYDAIATLVEPILAGTQGNAWTAPTTYSSGVSVLYNGIYYISNASVSPNENPPSSNAKWDVSEKLNFWSEFMKPYLVYACYKSFIIWHGKHISQGGIRKHTDNTSFEVDAENLAVLINDLKGYISVKETQMMNTLNRVEYTFDSIVYAENNYTKRSSVGIKIWDV